MPLIRKKSSISPITPSEVLWQKAFVDFISPVIPHAISPVFSPTTYTLLYIGTKLAMKLAKNPRISR